MLGEVPYAKTHAQTGDAMRNTLLTLTLGVLSLLTATPALAAGDAKTVLIEAEGFDDTGGWVIDQQFIDRMGSPILLAHGMGIPVEDAATTVELPAAGTYQVWVRTRDWVAPWKAPGAPGRFQLIVGGKPLNTTFGAEGNPWHWQSGGKLALPAGKVALALHDLTGFDGRCDAILLSADAGFAPPDDPKELAAFRKKKLNLPDVPEDAGEFDLVVVGGGMAGACAAIGAARSGLDVALIQNRPVLGGNNSSEVRVHLGGKICLPPYPAIGNLVRELDSGHHGNARPAREYGDDKKLAVARAEKSLHLFLNTHAYAVEKKGNRITAVLARNIRTNKELRFPAPLFVDCTGDGTIGFLAGADFHYGRESKAETGEALAPAEADRQVMGTSIMWYSVKTDGYAPFPECPWAAQFNDTSCQQVTSGNWNWENGFFRDQVTEAEYIRDYGLRVVYGNWAFQKNHAKNKAKYANMRLGWVAFVGGKRESRRLLGDVILKQEDITSARSFPDASVTTTWTIDLHYPVPTKNFAGEPFRSRAAHVRIKPYPIPYRCFYSRNIENLMMAGRNISVTHVALGTIRVMRTTGMMGEVVGMAASLCNKHDTTPRGVYEKHLDELKALMTKGVGKPGPPGTAGGSAPKPPAWLKDAGANLARSAKVIVSGNHKTGSYPAANVNDGRVSYSDNALRWVSDAKVPGWVELAWPTPQKISAIRIVTGQARARTPITDFVLQYRIGSDYKDIPGTKTTGNRSTDWGVKLPSPILTDRIRLKVTATPGDLTRIWELEAY